MLKPIHTRDTPLMEWPFESMDDVDEFMARVVEVVKDAIDAEPEVIVSATYPDRVFPTMTRDEFRDVRTDLSFEDLSSLVVQAHDREDPDFAVSLVLTDEKRDARLTVRGRSVTRVDGVDVQVRRALDKAIAKVEATREAEAQRRREERADYVERVAPSAPYGVPIGAAVGALVRGVKRKRSTAGPTVATRFGRWRRALNNPWTVAFVGGIATSIGAGVVLALVLG
jgi:hypothetical protein